MTHTDAARNGRLMTLAAALIWFGMYSYVPTLPAYAASIGADVAAIGIIGGVYGIGQMALRIPLGLLSDRLGRDRWLLVAGFAVLSLSCLLFLVTDTVDGLVWARTLAGFAAAWWVVISASFAKYQPEDRQVKAQGILVGSSNVGKVLAALSCAFAAQLLGYASTFAIALAGGLAGVASMCFLKDPRTRQSEPVPLRRQLALFGNRRLLAFSALSALSQMQCFALPTTYTPVVAEELGADSWQLGMLVTVYFGAMSAASFFVGSRPYRALGGIRVMILMFLAGAVACVPAFYATMPLIYVMQAIAGMSYGIVQAQTAGFVIRCVDPSQRGAATGIFQSLFAIGIFFGPILAGWIASGISFDAAFWAYAGIACAAAALCPVLIPKEYDAMS